MGFYEVLAVPFGYILGFFYDLSGSYLLSIFIITVLTRLLLLPSTIKQQKSAASQMRFQAKVKRIQEMYKGNPQKINEETQALYQREGFNPMSVGCLPMLIQFPVMIGLYSAIRTPLTSVLHLGQASVEAITTAGRAVLNLTQREQYMVEMKVLGVFDQIRDSIQGVSAADLADVEKFRESFTIFGLNLADTPEAGKFSVLWILPIISALTAMLSSIVMVVRQKKQNPEMGRNPMMGCTFLMGPVMSLYFGFLFPGGICVYWIMGNLLSFLQMLLLNHTHKPGRVLARLMVDETVQERSRENHVKNTAKYRD